jgi:hypothetical protein
VHQALLVGADRAIGEGHGPHPLHELDALGPADLLP